MPVKNDNKFCPFLSRNMKSCLSLRLKGAFVVVVVLIVVLRCYMFQNDAMGNFDNPLLISIDRSFHKSTEASEVEKNATKGIFNDANGIHNYSSYKLLHSTLDKGCNYSNHTANQTVEAIEVEKTIADKVLDKAKGILNHSINSNLHDTLDASANYSNHKVISPANRTKGATKKNITDEAVNKAKGILNHTIYKDLHNPLAVSANHSNHNFISQANHDFCTWRGFGHEELDCTNMLSKRLLLDSKIHLLTSKRWVFMGDSTMAKLFSFVRASMPSFFNSCNCQFKAAPRCDMYESFGLTKKKGSWKRPVKGLEGPIAYGLRVPHCQDCIGCYSVLMQCEHFPCNGTTISYMGVEFARDVVMQTELEGTSTTQESITTYLKSQQCLIHPFICIVNTGLHDMIILKRDGKTFIKNLEWYLTLIQPCCKHLVWIQTTAVLDEESRPQKNSIIKVWNAKVQALLQGKRFQNWTSIVDPYNASLYWPHADNVHLNMTYYAALASLFSQFLL
jgi:hypothetical protein